jgi:class 3 adenylate cyclase
VPPEMPFARMGLWGCLRVAEASKELGIDLHLGLHTGECEVRGDDLGGRAIHIAVCRSDQLRRRTGRSAGLGHRQGPGRRLHVDFVDRGEHQLRGVPASWRLYRAVS